MARTNILKALPVTARRTTQVSAPSFCPLSPELIARMTLHCKRLRRDQFGGEGTLVWYDEPLRRGRRLIQLDTNTPPEIDVSRVTRSDP